MSEMVCSTVIGRESERTEGEEKRGDGEHA